MTLRQRDAGKVLKEEVKKRASEIEETFMRQVEAGEGEDAPASSWGWLWMILGALALWGLLIVLGMCVWYAIKH
jgi:hypothetical protein